MKVFIVMCGEQYECAWTIKVFLSKEKALSLIETLEKEEGEDSSYSFFLREIEADLNE